MNLKVITKNIPTIATLKHIIPIRLKENYALLEQTSYEEYRKTKNIEHLDKMLFYLDKYKAIAAPDCCYYEGMALYHFCTNRNITKAKECVIKCKENKYPSLSYKFDDIFLKLYEKHSPYLAINSYKKYSAYFKKNVSFNLILEIEDFIIDVLKTEPEKVQLYWLLCLLSHHREDYELSQEYLDKYRNSDALTFNDDLLRYIANIEQANRKKISLI